MRALINFDTYASTITKQRAWELLLALADTYGWDVQMISEGHFIEYTTAAPYLIADTVAKSIQQATGTESYDNSYNAVTQFITIVNAITSNSRTVVQFGDFSWGFDVNGDVFINKKKVPSAVFEQIIAARTTAMGG